MSAYEKEAGVDWVQFEAPQSTDEIRMARERLSCTFSFMKGGLPRYLTLEEHRELGADAAWLPSFTHHVIWAAVSDFMAAFNEKGIGAWDEFLAARNGKPYFEPALESAGEGSARQAELEELYFAGPPTR